MPECSKLVKRIDKHLTTHKMTSAEESRYKSLAKIQYHNEKIMLKVGGQNFISTNAVELARAKNVNERIDVVTPPSTCNDGKTGAKKCALDIHCELNKFSDWLNTVDGGGLDHHVAKQHVSQLKKIVEWVGVVCPLTNSLCEHVILGDRLRVWFKEISSGPVGSTRSKVCSVQKFLDFLLQINSPCHRALNRNDLLIRKQRLTAWSMSLKKVDLQQRHARQIQARQNIIKPSDVSAFRSAPYRQKVMSTFRKKSTISSKQAISVRNLLITETMLGNAQRPSAIAGMTKQDWSNGTWQPNGFFSVSVSKHKTFVAHGVAMLTFSKELAGDVTMYIEKCRSHFRNAGENGSLFVNTTGTSINSMSVYNAMKSAWQFCGLPHHLTASLYRKSCVTHVHTSHPQLANSLAQQMTHKPSTAVAHYRLAATLQENAQTAETLQGLMCLSDQKQLPVLVEHDKLTSDEILFQTVQKRHPRRSFTSDDVHLIENTFHKEIADGKILTAQVLGLLPVIHEQLSQPFTTKQIHDRIKCTIRKQLKLSKQCRKE